MTPDEAKVLFDVLGVPPGAPRDELQVAYRHLVLVWHPDRFARNEALQKKAEEQLKRINAAYERLTSEPIESEEAAPPPPPEPSQEPPQEPSPPAPVKRPRRWRASLVGAALLGVVVLLGLVRTSLADEPTFKPASTQDVPLSVTSNEPVEVFVRHREAGPGVPLTRLGKTPLREKWGAHLFDVVILENKLRGIHYEEELRYGSPGQTKTINKEFASGSFIPRVSPANSVGMAFYLGNQEVGRYIHGAPISLVEGEYDLELRGPRLRRPVPVHVRIVAGKRVPTALIDLRDAVE